MVFVCSLRVHITEKQIRPSYNSKLRVSCIIESALHSDCNTKPFIMNSFQLRLYFLSLVQMVAPCINRPRFVMIMTLSSSACHY
jgi:hypothetical protein